MSILRNIQVIDSPEVSKVVHILMGLPTQKGPFIKELEKLYYSLIWSG